MSPKPRLDYTESKDMASLIRVMPASRAWFEFFGRRVGPNSRLPAAPVEAFLARPAAWAQQAGIMPLPATERDVAAAGKLVPAVVMSPLACAAGQVEVAEIVFIALLSRPMCGIVLPPPDLDGWHALCRSAGVVVTSGASSMRSNLVVGKLEGARARAREG